MAVSAESILSLADLKVQLRISHTDHDKLLESLRLIAINNISNWTNIAMLDRDISLYGQLDSDRVKLNISVNNLVSIDTVRYWEGGQGRVASPSGQLESENLRWWQESDGTNKKHIYYSTDGFRSGYTRYPAALNDIWIVDCKVGLQVVPEDLVGALICVVRDLYDARKIDLDANYAMFVRRHINYACESPRVVGSFLEK